MKKTLIIIAWILMTNTAWCQQTKINHTQFEAGIYKTFEEFKANSPSIPLQYEITASKEGYGLLNLGGKFTYYHLAIDKMEGKSIGNVFGFSDGKNMYINDLWPRLGPYAKFFKMDPLGQYGYFEKIEFQTSFNSTTAPGSTAKVLTKYVIDLNTGQVFKLSKRLVKTIISDDPELFDEFRNDDLKKLRLKEYIIKYSVRNYN